MSLVHVTCHNPQCPDPADTLIPLQTLGRGVLADPTLVCAACGHHLERDTHPTDRPQDLIPSAFHHHHADMQAHRLAGRTITVDATVTYCTCGAAFHHQQRVTADNLQRIHHATATGQPMTSWTAEDTP